MKSLNFVFGIFILALLVSCSKTTDNSDANRDQQKFENEVIGLSGVEIGPYYSFQSVPAVDPKAGGLCVAYRFEFKMNSSDNIEDFSLQATFFNKSCDVNLFVLDLIGSGHFLNGETKILDATLKYALMTSVNDQATSAFNKDKSCGLKWDTNQRVDVLNTSCVKSDRGRLYLGKKGRSLVLYSCEANEEINSNCKRVEMQEMH